MCIYIRSPPLLQGTLRGMTREEAQAIYRADEETGVRVLVDLSARVNELTADFALLKAENSPRPPANQNAGAAANKAKPSTPPKPPAHLIKNTAAARSKIPRPSLAHTYLISYIICFLFYLSFPIFFFILPAALAF